MGHFSIWLQEMKMPAIGEEEILQSVRVTPMLSAEWQALQDPEREVEDPDDGKFLWDGTYLPNPKLIGSWSQLGQVAAIEEFSPSSRPRHRANWPLQRITFSERGKTTDALHIWSGDILMNLANNQAQRMEVRTMEGADYLFIEGGGFSTRNAADWQSPWYVYRRDGD